jgi:hypothetical protein
VVQQPDAAPRRQDLPGELGEEDRTWLAERLVEYKDLLGYLHAN